MYLVYLIQTLIIILGPCNLYHRLVTQIVVIFFSWCRLDLLNNRWYGAGPQGGLKTRKGSSSNMMGIICPPNQIRVNFSVKIQGTDCPLPPAPTALYGILCGSVWQCSAACVRINFNSHVLYFFFCAMIAFKCEKIACATTCNLTI